MPPQSVMHARARSVNAQALGSGSKHVALRAKINKSSIQGGPMNATVATGFFSQEKNRSSTSQGKRFNFVGNNPQFDHRFSGASAFPMDESNFHNMNFTPSALQQAQATR